MLEKLEELFQLNEPELVLESYAEPRRAVFRLLDCDGYRLGAMICEDVHLLCITTCWESFDRLSIYSKKDVPAQLEWLQESIPEEYSVVILRSAADEDVDSALPDLCGERAGFLVCRAVRFLAETDPGR